MLLRALANEGNNFSSNFLRRFSLRLIRFLPTQLLQKRASFLGCPQVRLGERRFSFVEVLGAPTCRGCGVQLQSTNPEADGYRPDEYNQKANPSK